MSMKIKVRFKDGHTRVLKPAEKLNDINQDREALFVMMDGSVYTGWSEGDIDEDGGFTIWRTIHGVTLPFKDLLGWCYVKGR